MIRIDLYFSIIIARYSLLYTENEASIKKLAIKHVFSHQVLQKQMSFSKMRRAISWCRWSVGSQVTRMRNHPPNVLLTLSTNNADTNPLSVGFFFFSPPKYAYHIQSSKATPGKLLLSSSRYPFYV